MAQAVPVLMYHHVSPSPGLVTVSPETFEAHMAGIAHAGYSALSAEAFAGFMRGERAVPAKSVLITFDDGYLDNYVHAWPLLKRHGLRAMIFAVTGWIGEGPARPASGGGATLPATPDHKTCKRAIAEGRADEVIVRWSEVEAMAADGVVEFHSHTHSHTRWDKAVADPQARRVALAADLKRSRDTLAARLDVRQPHLCWPQGYYDELYLDVARAAGFTAMHTTEPRANVAGGPLERIGRLVTKDRAGDWLNTRLAIYSRPWLARLYGALSGRD